MMEAPGHPAAWPTRVRFDPHGASLVPRWMTCPLTIECRYFNGGITRMLDQADWDTLSAAARAASRHAHCPYSRYAVGAAVRTADGRIFTGCNVENASFGLSMCAERNAIFQAVASGSRDLVAVVLYTPTAQPASPCGACRQVILEFGPAPVMACCDGAATSRWGAAQLLPGAFSLDRKA